MATGGLPYGLQNMLKEGHKHFSGTDEAILRNIEACKELAKITRTSMGPNGTFEVFFPSDSISIGTWKSSCITLMRVWID